MSRTTNSLRNIKYSLIGQVVSLLANFLTRMIFVRVLSAEYLGINGLFTNILSILSFAEMGIGQAIVYSMYKPLSDKNEDTLIGLMDLYKKAYIYIGLTILILGGSLTPFLSFFIKEMPNIDHIKIIYILFVINTASTYFFSYKRSFLIADQKKYIDAFYHYMYFTIRSILQIAILLITKDFLLYLIVQVIITIIENITISLKVDKLYPFLNSRKVISLDTNIKKSIIVNTKAMVFHKLGAVVVGGTDNLIISKFVGIVTVGLYSNYLLIIGALRQIFNIVFQSMIASIGNLGVTENNEKKLLVFSSIDLIGAWIYGFASICLIILFNPFIRLWLGEDYLFPPNVVLLIVISFYLSGRRKSVLAFRDALGLFWYDRYKPFFESIVNLVVSIYLAISLGISGVLLGTIISTLTTSFWIEPKVLYKYGLKSTVKSYFLKYVYYTIVIIVVGVITWLISSYFATNTLTSFIGKILVSIILPNIMFGLVFWKNKEFQYLLNIMKATIKR